MKTTKPFRVLSFILCALLIAAMAVTTGCTDKEQPKAPTTAPSVAAENVLGQGERAFFFTVTDKEGKETAYHIRTDRETVGEALQELGLLAGEEGLYGLYVKTVAGTTVDFDTDGKYWAFYVNGTYASQGVDVTPIQEGEQYAFKVEQ